MNTPVFTIVTLLITFVMLLGRMQNCMAQDLHATAYFTDVTTSHMPIDTNSHVLDVSLVDVNDDSMPDMVLAFENEPNRVYLYDGSVQFLEAEADLVEANHDTEHVRVADMDNDGFLDVVLVAEDNQNHEYYLGNGDGNFQKVSARLPAKSEA